MCSRLRGGTAISTITNIFSEHFADRSEPTGKAVDITNCDREPIHIPGTIQPFGFLVAVSTDWLVSRVSDNIESFIGRPPDHLLGKPLKDMFCAEAEHALRNLVSQLRGTDAIERTFNLQLTESGALFDVAVHYSGRSLVIEAEPVSDVGVDAATLVRTMVVRLDQIEGMENFLREGARQIRTLTGFDRVMVYRFDSAGSGEVVGEAVRTGVESFLGLNYPASDIPAQARTLYLRSVFRIIADVKADAVPITPVLDLTGEPLDQSISLLRAVSPIHLEYLRNMGVQASLSISIIVDGALWGLFACHHYEPRLPSFAHRSAAELFGRMFSMMLERRERDMARTYVGKARAVADQIMTSAARDGTRLKNAAWLGDVIFGAIPADGVGVSIEGEVVLTGLTPDARQFEGIVDKLNRLSPSQVFSTDCISRHLPDALDFPDRAVGMLAIPTSRSPRDYVVLFRAERIHAVRWAGNPEKEIEHGPNGPRLTPRKSFEAWSKLVEGTSLPFTPTELQVAETLRVALLEVVLQLSDSVSRERAQANAQQETLIAELNHRVRNILSLIRGLISQTRENALTADTFVKTLDDRVQALARAHDQLTAKRWAPARLIDLIRTETHAYLGEQRDRIVMVGPNVLIDPSAFTVLALVVHELVTNAAKYGALSDGGSVHLGWTLDAGRNLALRWREAGGPPVSQPKCKGFGSTIIERSIPHDLGGRADISYESAGFAAEFLIPSRFIGEVLPDVEHVDLPLSDIVAVGRPLAELVVLLVEDSMIIAMDCEDSLRELGAREVLTAATVEQAFRLIHEHIIDFAILDFNLGDETSVAVAKVLAKRQVPYAFATGYGEAPDVDDALAQIEVIRKPYSTHTLAAAIKAAGAGGSRQ